MQSWVYIVSMTSLDKWQQICLFNIIQLVGTLKSVWALLKIFEGSCPGKNIPCGSSMLVICTEFSYSLVGPDS